MKWLLSLILVLGNTVAFSQAAAQADHHTWKRFSFIKDVLNDRSYGITINSQPASYDTLLRIADSNLVSVQVIRPIKKKKLVTSPGIIRVTTYEKEPFTGTTYYTPDSSRYYIKDADTIFFKLAKEARLYPEDATTSQSWRRFLQKKLRGEYSRREWSAGGHIHCLCSLQHQPRWQYHRCFIRNRSRLRYCTGGTKRIAQQPGMATRFL